ncbi:allophanate hydrolase subunit 1 [uncultured Cohaesibacter sp.]|uniref:5-oxoprolinase subunit B family protein n=1 Tax=uncultured Cohaesibacter sp. TaxID=1002546 RepID=UPI00292FBC86|nr:allophanate hydrolase subunit 1 [uncultured Cohaesibacter sp.]
MAVRFLPSGDSGLTIEFGLHIDRNLSRQIMALRAAVDDAKLVGVIETVPTYRSLLVHYDPTLIRQAELVAMIEPMIAHLGEQDGHGARLWRLPICFEADFATDLGHVAEFGQMDVAELRTILTGTDHFVYMLGFAPGMPYMGDLPSQLNIPRRKAPALDIAKGSVLVATGLTIIYPAVNPSGWHVVGRCPVPMFDLSRDEPALLSPGDIVRFRDVGLSEFSEIADRIEEGSYPLEGENI